MSEGESLLQKKLEEIIQKAAGDKTNVKIGFDKSGQFYTVASFQKKNYSQELTDLIEQELKQKGFGEILKIKNYDTIFTVSAKRYITRDEKAWMGVISDAKGRLFEYYFFSTLQSIFRRYEGATQKDAQYDSLKAQAEASQVIADAIAHLSKDSQSKYKELDNEIFLAAMDAVKQVVADLPPEEIKEKILYALAGSNPQGDAFIKGYGGIELKFTSSTSDRVKYFTLNDIENFRGMTPLQRYAKAKGFIGGQQVWRSKEKTLSENDWVNAVRIFAFQDYVLNYLMSKTGNAQNLFKYLLQKGGDKSWLQQINKKLVVGVDKGTNGRRAIKIDLDAVFGTIEEISLSASTSTIYFNNTTGNSNIRIAQLTTERSTIVDDSRDEQAIARHEKPGDLATTFLFFLQKGFYS